MSASSRPTSGAPKSARCDGTKQPGATVSLPVLALERTDGGKIRKSKAGKWRVAVLITVHVLMAAHIVQWWLMGGTLSPVEPSETMHTLVKGAVNAGAVFFAVAILSTLIFGRFFCGWGCHIVAMQDLCGWAMKKIGVRPKPFRTRILAWAPVVFAFYMFIWPNFSRYIYEPLAERFFPAALEFTGRIMPFPKQGFTNEFIVDEFWATFPPWYVAVPFLLVCGFATVYFLGAKGFCTYGCPYGGIFGPVDKLAIGRIVVDHDKCHQCGHCTAVCTSNVRVHDEIREYGMVVDAGCMKCMDCVSVCPNTALSWKFARPGILKGKPKNKAPKRVYDMTLAEDAAFSLIMLACFMAIRGAYNIMSSLFAIGTAAILTFIFYKAWRMLRERDVRLMTFQLKRLGKPTKTGLAYALISLLLIAATVHTGYINLHKWRGNQLANKITLAPALAFDASARPFPEDALEHARGALKHFALVDSFSHGGKGLMPERDVQLRAALLHLLLDRTDDAKAILNRVQDRHGAHAGLTAEIVKILRLEGKPEEAEALIDRTLAEHPRFWEVRELRVYSLLGEHMQRIGRQISIWNPPQEYTSVVARDPRIAAAIADAKTALEKIPVNWKTARDRGRTRLLLARMLAAIGEPQNAIEQLRLGVKDRPKSFVLQENLGAALLQTATSEQDLDGVIVHLTHAAEHDPGSIDKWLMLAGLQVQRNRIADGVVSYSKAARLEPGVLVDLYVTRAQRAADSPEFKTLDRMIKELRPAIDRAITTVKRQIGDKPDDAELRYRLGVLSLAIADNDDALKAFSDGLPLVPPAYLPAYQEQVAALLANARAGVQLEQWNRAAVK